MFKRSAVHYGRTPAGFTKVARRFGMTGSAGVSRPGSGRWMAFGCLFSLPASSPLLSSGSQHRSITPWVVEVDRLGSVKAVAPAN